jgi:hypothetical protein
LLSHTDSSALKHVHPALHTRFLVWYPLQVAFTHEHQRAQTNTLTHCTALHCAHASSQHTAPLCTARMICLLEQRHKDSAFDCAKFGAIIDTNVRSVVQLSARFGPCTFFTQPQTQLAHSLNACLPVPLLCVDWYERHTLYLTFSHPCISCSLNVRTFGQAGVSIHHPITTLASILTPSSRTFGLGWCRA